MGEFPLCQFKVKVEKFEIKMAVHIKDYYVSRVVVMTGIPYSRRSPAKG